MLFRSQPVSALCSVEVLGGEGAVDVQPVSALCSVKVLGGGLLLMFSL